MCLQEEAKAVKLFEELLDSAASAADSQALHTAAESSHISSATGKAYRALKELVKAALPRMAYAKQPLLSLFDRASLLVCAGGGPVRGPKPDAVRPGEVRGRRRQR